MLSRRTRGPGPCPSVRVGSRAAGCRRRTAAGIRRGRRRSRRHVQPIPRRFEQSGVPYLKVAGRLLRAAAVPRRRPVQRCLWKSGPASRYAWPGGLNPAASATDICHCAHPRRLVPGPARHRSAAAVERRGVDYRNDAPGGDPGRGPCRVFACGIWSSGPGTAEPDHSGEGAASLCTRGAAAAKDRRYGPRGRPRHRDCGHPQRHTHLRRRLGVHRFGPSEHVAVHPAGELDQRSSA